MLEIVKDGIKYEQENFWCWTVAGLVEPIKHIVLQDYINGIIVSKIKERAFYESDIESVELSETIGEIGRQAFEKSTIKKITRSFALGSLQVLESAFANCSELEEVDFSRTTQIDEGVFLGKNAFQNCHKLKTFDTFCISRGIPEGVFENTALQEFVISEDVSEIHPFAFKNVSLNKIVFPHDLPQGTYLTFLANFPNATIHCEANSQYVNLAFNGQPIHIHPTEDFNEYFLEDFGLPF